MLIIKIEKLTQHKSRQIYIYNRKKIKAVVVDLY
jgi:hypothetical protein